MEGQRGNQAVEQDYTTTGLVDGVIGDVVSRTTITEAESSPKKSATQYWAADQMMLELIVRKILVECHVQQQNNQDTHDGNHSFQHGPDAQRLLNRQIEVFPEHPETSIVHVRSG